MLTITEMTLIKNFRLLTPEGQIELALLLENAVKRRKDEAIEIEQSPNIGCDSKIISMAIYSKKLA